MISTIESIKDFYTTSDLIHLLKFTLKGMENGSVMRGWKINPLKKYIEMLKSEDEKKNFKKG